MPKGYQHLTQDKRCQIYAFKKSGKNQMEISKEVNVSQSTVCREIQRNSGKKGYRHKQAHEKTLKRRLEASLCIKKMTGNVLFLAEKMLVNDQLSPEQISGRLSFEYKTSISHETVYKHIWNDKHSGGNLYKNLRRSGKKYNKRAGKLAGRGLIPNRVDIDSRPAEVNAKNRVGDFEGESIIEAQHQSSILSLVERKTRVTLLRLLSGPKAHETARAIVEKLEPIKNFVKTITTDNGKEFAQHEFVAQKLNAKFYFAHPYHAWEGGLNENTNGLVRQYFPKGCDFSKLSEQQVLDVEKKLNNRPRKTLGYRTPSEEFLRLTKVDLNYALQY